MRDWASGLGIDGGGGDIPIGEDIVVLAGEGVIVDVVVEEVGGAAGTELEVDGLLGLQLEDAVLAGDLLQLIDGEEGALPVLGAERTGNGLFVGLLDGHRRLVVVGSLLAFLRRGAGRTRSGGVGGLLAVLQLQVGMEDDSVVGDKEATLVVLVVLVVEGTLHQADAVVALHVDHDLLTDKQVVGEVVVADVGRLLGLGLLSLLLEDGALDELEVHGATSSLDGLDGGGGRALLLLGSHLLVVDADEDGADGQETRALSDAGKTVVLALESADLDVGTRGGKGEAEGALVEGDGDIGPEATLSLLELGLDLGGVLLAEGADLVVGNGAGDGEGLLHEVLAGNVRDLLEVLLEGSGGLIGVVLLEEGGAGGAEDGNAEGADDGVNLKADRTGAEGNDAEAGIEEELGEVLGDVLDEEGGQELCEVGIDVHLHGVDLIEKLGVLLGEETLDDTALAAVALGVEGVVVLVVLLQEEDEGVVGISLTQVGEDEVGDGGEANEVVVLGVVDGKALEDLAEGGFGLLVIDALKVAINVGHEILDLGLVLLDELLVAKVLFGGDLSNRLVEHALPGVLAARVGDATYGEALLDGVLDGGGVGGIGLPETLLVSFGNFI